MYFYQKLLIILIFCFTFASLQAQVKSTNNEGQLNLQDETLENSCSKCLEPARIDFEKNVNFAISASYLYFLPLQKDLFEVAEFIPTTPATQSYEEKLLKPHFHSGFKVGFNVSGGEDQWEFFAEYTWLHSKDHRKFTLSSGFSGMNEYWTSSDETTFQTKTKWKLVYDIATFDFGRPSYFGKNLVIKPYVGIKAGAINQKLRAEATQANLEEFLSIYRSNSWLLGPSIGLKNSYFFTKNFKLINDLSIHLMYQKFNVKAENFNLSNSSENSSNKWKPGFITPNVNLNLGLDYGDYFNDNYAHFNITLSYDFIYYFNQNMLRRIRVINYGSDTGDLMIQALNASIRFDF